MDFGIVPVSPFHGRFEIVDHQRLGSSAEMVKGVLQRADERFAALMPDYFAVALTRM